MTEMHQVAIMYNLGCIETRLKQDFSKTTIAMEQLKTKITSSKVVLRSNWRLKEYYQKLFKKVLKY